MKDPGSINETADDGMTAGNGLRRGITTGTSTAAAAQAAAVFLLSGEQKKEVTIRTPKGITVSIPVIFESGGEERAVFCVRKYSGDDPDVTDGALVYASVEKTDFFDGETVKKGYLDHRFPLLCLTGAEGIGLVTKDGLACPKGNYAINPVPRTMIFQAVDQVREALGYEGLLLVTVFIPEGRRLAEKTFNPNLGILGGISILGTSGIVEPMSEEALIETIRLEIHMHAVEGKRKLTITPGNYGWDFLKSELGASMEGVVKCSNFVGNAMDILMEEGFKNIVFVGHIGKLIKVAGGVMNTHSRYGDRRMEIMADCAREAGADQEVIQKVESSNTTEEGLGWLKAAGFMEKTMEIAAGRIKFYLEKGREGISVEVVTFSKVYGILGRK